MDSSTSYRHFLSWVPTISPTVLGQFSPLSFATPSTASELIQGALSPPALVDGSEGGALVPRGGRSLRWRWLLPGGKAGASGGSRQVSPQIGAANSPVRLWRYTCLRMAWRFRKSIKLGPLRLNLSKSGIGTSIGVRGFRVGTDAKGRSYTAASIPGTGLYSRTYSRQGKIAGGNAAAQPGAPPGQASGKGISVGAVILAFMAGGLVVSVLMPRATVPPPVTPPAAVSAPVAPAQPIPAKRRRAHRPLHVSKKASASELVLQL